MLLDMFVIAPHRQMPQSQSEPLFGMGSEAAQCFAITRSANELPGV